MGGALAAAGAAVTLAVTPLATFGAAFTFSLGAPTTPPYAVAVGIARNARVPLCPPNPMEFDNAAVTWTGRA